MTWESNSFFHGGYPQNAQIGSRGRSSTIANSSKRTKTERAVRGARHQQPRPTIALYPLRDIGLYPIIAPRNTSSASNARPAANISVCGSDLPAPASQPTNFSGTHDASALPPHTMPQPAKPINNSGSIRCQRQSKSPQNTTNMSAKAPQKEASKTLANLDQHANSNQQAIVIFCSNLKSCAIFSVLIGKMFKIFLF